MRSSVNLDILKEIIRFYQVTDVTNNYAYVREIQAIYTNPIKEETDICISCTEEVSPDKDNFYDTCKEFRTKTNKSQYSDDIYLTNCNNIRAGIYYYDNGEPKVSRIIKYYVLFKN